MVPEQPRHRRTCEGTRLGGAKDRGTIVFLSPEDTKVLILDAYRRARPEATQRERRRQALETQRGHLPKLCRAISARHLDYQLARGSRRRQQLRDEVRRATYHLHAQGRYPSGYRVAQLLSEPAAILNAVARAAWREALRELGWQT